MNIEEQIHLFQKLASAPRPTPSSRPSKTTRQRLERHVNRSRDHGRKKAVRSLLDCAACTLTFKRHLMYAHEYLLQSGKRFTLYFCPNCDLRTHKDAQREQFYLHQEMKRTTHNTTALERFLKDSVRLRTCKLLYNHDDSRKASMGRYGQGVLASGSLETSHRAAASPITPTQSGTLRLASSAPTLKP